MVEVRFHVSNDEIDKLTQRLVPFAESLIHEMEHPTEGNARSASATTTYVFVKRILMLMAEHKQLLREREAAEQQQRKLKLESK